MHKKTTNQFLIFMSRQQKPTVGEFELFLAIADIDQAILGSE